MELLFYQVDVFTDQALSGNPLAVFVDPNGLTDPQLLKIAREMNLSETTFVYPTPEPNIDSAIRIFTPGKEIPFAGHPAIGTAHVLLETGRLDRDKIAYTFQMGVGPISITRKDSTFWMKQPQPEFSRPTENKDHIIEALGLSAPDIDPHLPIQVVSTGFPAILVPLQSLEASKKIEINTECLKTVLGDLDMIYTFTLETEDSNSTAHTRGFAPFIGIPEDPATGSVSGALGAYLAQHKVIKGSNLQNMVFEQGMEMGRPSKIQVSVTLSGGNIQTIEVGGTAKTVLEGNLKI